jgi:gliding motility-associated lipoprotein GldD
MYIKNIVMGILAAVLLTACGGGDIPQPKPKAYLRVDMPAPDYVAVDTVKTPDSLGGISFPAPFTFEKNRHAIISQAKYSKRGAAIEICYPQWSGYVELMYKHLAGRNDLQSQIDTAMRMLEYHYRVAAGIDEELIQVPDNHVYATVWHINGRDVASTCQFVVTDSNAHFLHGEVIIDQSPNNDSLAPMLNYMWADVDYLIKNLRWK